MGVKSTSLYRWRNAYRSYQSSRICATKQSFKEGLESRIEPLTGDPFIDCWKANSWSVNPYGDETIDGILQSLHSPAPQSFFVLQRSLNMTKGDRSGTVESALASCRYLLKDRYHFIVVRESCRDAGVAIQPGIDWNVLTNTSEVPSNWKAVSDGSTSAQSLIQIANEILGHVSWSSELQCPIDECFIDRLLDCMEDRLHITLGTDIRGRTSADTAFTLALAGVSRQTLYRDLVRIAGLEMNRVRKRTSRRAKDVAHMAEKLAAAGLKGKEVEDVYRVSAGVLGFKGATYDIVESMKTPEKFDMLCPRPLMWLWRSSSKQVKPRQVLREAEEGIESVYSQVKLDNFKDCGRPLVVDIGCGLGVSLIGLASRSSFHEDDYSSNLLPTTKFSECNFIGGDLSQMAIRFGRGISKRWGLADRLHYTYASAEHLVGNITEIYPGYVALVLIQFPSPFILEGKKIGNTQLPSGPDCGFMVTESLMANVAHLLQNSGGRLLLQSNCEDVAVHMKEMAVRCGLAVIAADDPVTDPQTEGLPQRTMDWIGSGGTRAVGPEWSRTALLPYRCATETEIACEIKGTPVHRCLLGSKL